MCTFCFSWTAFLYTAMKDPFLRTEAVPRYRTKNISAERIALKQSTTHVPNVHNSGKPLSALFDYFIAIFIVSLRDTKS